jgi:chromosome segregation ATPase
MPAHGLRHKAGEITREEADALIKDLPPLEDPMAKWRREADEAAERRAKAKEDLRAAERQTVEMYANAGALAEMDARLETKVAELVEAVGECIGAERVRHERALERAIDELRRELKAAFAEQVATVRGEVRGSLDALK